MPKYILGARGHDYRKGRVKDIFSLMRQDGWTCTQLAFKKLVDGVKSYEDVTPELIKEVEAAMREEEAVPLIAKKDQAFMKRFI